MAQRMGLFTGLRGPAESEGASQVGGFCRDMLRRDDDTSEGVGWNGGGRFDDGGRGGMPAGTGSGADGGGGTSK